MDIIENATRPLPVEPLTDAQTAALVEQVTGRLTAAQVALGEAQLLPNRYARENRVELAQRRIRSLKAELALALEGRPVPRLDLRAELSGAAFTVIRNRDDDVVTVARTGEVVWFDCPSCGTRPPVLSHRTEEPVMVGNGGIGWTQAGTKVRYQVERLVTLWADNPRTGKRERHVGQRCDCGFWGRLRLIRSTGTDGRGKVRDGRWYCSGACLGGKYTCDCRCLGLCHGRGTCDGH